MIDTADLLIKAESLKGSVAARVTDGYADHGTYYTIREELVELPRIKGKLPRFVIACQSLDAAWRYIQPKFKTYRERLYYLEEEFAPLLAMLESEAASPSDSLVSETVETIDLTYVRNAWEKCLERRSADPDGAITAARTLLETVCKHILDEAGIAYADRDDLPKLYGLAATQLRLAPSQHTESEIKKILGGCFTVVDGLACLRNRLSDAHGKGKNAAQSLQRHAELAVNLAGGVATFLVATWEADR